MFNSGLYLPILIFAFCFFFLAICRQCRDKVKKICQEEKLTNCQVDSSTKKVQERTSSLHATKQCSDLSIDDCDRKECEGFIVMLMLMTALGIFLNSMRMAIALRVAFIVVVKAMTSAKFKCPVALVIVVVTIVRVAMIILVAITLVMREMLALILIIRKMTAVIMFAL